MGQTVICRPLVSQTTKYKSICVDMNCISLKKGLRWTFVLRCDTVMPCSSACALQDHAANPGHQWPI